MEVGHLNPAVQIQLLELQRLKTGRREKGRGKKMMCGVAEAFGKTCDSHPVGFPSEELIAQAKLLVVRRWTTVVVSSSGSQSSV